MESLDQKSSAQEQYVHLHMAFDTGNEQERRFVELFNALPQGFKAHFCKSLLVDSIPASDADIDLLLAKFIRQKKFRMKRRGRPPQTKAPIASRAAEPGPHAGASSKAHVGEIGKGGPVTADRPSAAGNLAEFSELAGGQQWNP